MKDKIDNTTQNQDFIDLGVASVETLGGGISGEPDGGGPFFLGISEE